MPPAPAAAVANEPTLERWNSRLTRALPWAAIIIFALWCYVAVRPAHLWDDAEPEILNMAWRVARGEPVYKDIETPPYVLTAYPPVYLEATAAGLRVAGLSTLPGKLISLLSAIAIGLAFARLSREWHGDAKRGWLVFSALLMIPAFLYNTARIHVQMLAVALSIWSLVLLMRGRWLDVALWSPLLAVLAIYIKQSQIAVPLAGAFYLLMRQPRRAAIYIGALGAMALPPLLYLQDVTGGYFLRHTVEWNALSYTLRRLGLSFAEHVGPVIFFFVLACGLVARRIRNRENRGGAELLDFYFTGLAILTIASLGRIGAHTQYVVELHCAVALILLRAGGLSLPSRWIPVQIVALMLYTPVFIAQKAARALPAYEAAPKVHALLNETPGPILSEQMSFTLFSGREPYLQLFHFEDLARLGKWDESRFVREIEQRAFAYVITEFPIEETGAWRLRHRERFNPAVREAILRNYARSQVIGPYFLYRPR